MSNNSLQILLFSYDFSDQMTYLNVNNYFVYIFFVHFYAVNFTNARRLQRASTSE